MAEELFSGVVRSARGVRGARESDRRAIRAVKSGDGARPRRPYRRAGRAEQDRAAGGQGDGQRAGAPASQARHARGAVPRAQAGARILSDIEGWAGASGAHGGVSLAGEQSVFATLATIRPLEFYMPVAPQRETWTGKADVLVVSQLDESAPIVAFDEIGNSVRLDRKDRRRPSRRSRSCR